MKYCTYLCYNHVKCPHEMCMLSKETIMTKRHVLEVDSIYMKYTE